jgi:CRP-like cAMP-binding protein
VKGSPEGAGRKLRPSQRIIFKALTSGGGCCLVYGFALGRHSFRLNRARPPRFLGTSAEIAGVVVLVAVSITILMILGLVVRCLWKAVRHGGDQDLANRWLNLATRLVYLVTGGRLSGLRTGPAQFWDEVSTPASTASRASRTSFWESLTRDEQTGLVASAAETTFPANEVLCREGQQADHVFVIRSGRVKVCVGSPDRPQLIAIRHTGDIVGERAALRVTERSATITALESVSAYVIPTGDFAAFLERHHRVLAIIENQVYDRLTENHSQAALIDDRLAVSGAPSAGSLTGQNCTVILIDIADYSARARSDQDRRKIRSVLYQILQSLFENADFRQHDYHQEDRGDGVLLVIPPRVPTSTIVDYLLSDLVSLLRQHNKTARPATRIQMRIALHVGPVVSDAHGVDGRAIIHTARLLDAPALKRDLARSGADLGFITSDFVYGTIIQPNPGHADPAAYHRLRCQVKKEPIDAWVYLARTTGESESLTANADPPGLISAEHRESAQFATLGSR